MSNQKSKINWQQIYSCRDGIEAQLVKNLMEINEIPVNLKNVISNAMFPDSSIAEVTVWVPETYAETAKKLIKKNFK